MVAPFFTPEHIEAMRPQIQKTVNYFLEEMIKGGCKEPVDLVEKFALPIPSRVSLFPPSSPLSLSLNYKPSRQD